MASHAPTPADPQADRPARQVGRLLKQVFTGLIRSIDTRMQPLGLTAMQWEPLLLLYVGKVDTVAALARQSQVNCASMTRMLDRLESKGLLRRRRSDEDRRVVHLELTPRGLEVAGDIVPLVNDALDHHLRGFSAAEVDTLIHLLGRMQANGTHD
jgi:DNA-binding MarR family transcriptional regulator